MNDPAAYLVHLPGCNSAKADIFWVETELPMIDRRRVVNPLGNPPITFNAHAQIDGWSLIGLISSIKWWPHQEANLLCTKEFVKNSNLIKCRFCRQVGFAWNAVVPRLKVPKRGRTLPWITELLVALVVVVVWGSPGHGWAALSRSMDTVSWRLLRSNYNCATEYYVLYLIVFTVVLLFGEGISYWPFVYISGPMYIRTCYVCYRSTIS